jgi:tRNA-splicing ligase RtcB
MLEYQGKYGKATVMVDEIDQTTVKQIYDFLNHEAFTNQISIMPDTHAGKGSVIGFTMPIVPDKIIPNVVGVDINCGMLLFTLTDETFPKDLNTDQRMKIDEEIRRAVPFGTNVHNDPVEIESWFWKYLDSEYRAFIMRYNNQYGTKHDLITFDMKWFEEKCEQIEMPIERAIQSIGTLGGGNHFIEMGKSVRNGKYAFTIHTGSRQFGLKVCNYWQKKAGSNPLDYLSGEDAFGYLTDMVVAQCYARMNRYHIYKHILSCLGLSIEKNVQTSIETSHNFIDFDDFIVRKGAIRSYQHEKMVIPFNMQDGIIVCEGKSNPLWNYSAPHGAGRVGSRRWAKKNLNLEEAQNNMNDNDIFCSKLPLDEAKGAYKDPKIIEEAIEPTADIIDRFKPILAMKD